MISVCIRGSAYLRVLAISAGVLGATSAGCRATDGQPNGGWDAAWSGDGNRIAFTSGSQHDIPNLWVVGANGTGLRRITNLGAHEPHWLPGGKTIVFGTVRTGKAMYMSVDADGQAGSEKPVEGLPAGAEDPVWTADGSLVAYGLVTKNGAARDIWFARTSGGRPTGVTAKFWCREWAWAPNGHEIAYIVGRSTGTSIWTIDIATQDMSLLYEGFCSAVSYSPDGKRLAFAVPDVKSGFHPVVVDLATRKETSIDVRSFNGARLLWSPDGSALYFSSSRKAEPAIWMVHSDGTGLKRITKEGTPTLSPALSPDGTKFACQVVTKRAYGQEVQVVDTAGRTLASLTPRTSPSFWAPVWSPSGKDFACQSDVNHFTELFVGSPSGRLSKPYARIYGADPADVLWLPSGKSLLVSDAGRLMLVDKPGKTYVVHPFPHVTTMVQSPRLHGTEIVVSAWGARDIFLAAVNLDGTNKRMLTQKPAEPAVAPGPPLAHPAKPAPVPGPAAGPTHAHVTDASSTGNIVTLGSYIAALEPVAESAPAPPPAVPAAPAAPVAPKETPGVKSDAGNPHANLGIMGPQENLAAAERPAVIDSWPAISPNGKTVAFARDNQVWLVGIDGANERKLTALAKTEDAQRNIGGPCWAPDGKSIAFTAVTSAQDGVTLELWRCGTAAGSETRIYSEPVASELGMYYSGCTSGPAFTPDGKRVVFTSIAGSGPRVMSIAIEGGEPTELAPAPSSYPALDSTGARLAYVDLSDGHERIRVRDIVSGSMTGPLFRK